MLKNFKIVLVTVGVFFYGFTRVECPSIMLYEDGIAEAPDATYQCPTWMYYDIPGNSTGVYTTFYPRLQTEEEKLALHGITKIH